MGISKYSNSVKSDCIDYGVVEYVKRTQKELYKSQDGEKFLQWCEFITRDPLIDCSIRLLESEYRKYARARDHIRDLVLSGNAVFITLTFRDDVLQKTSPRTRRKYVARYLSSQCSKYVANIDYSPKKEREHYHAVVDNRCDRNMWHYGFVWTEIVRTQDFNCNRVAKYVAKLTSHAFKVSSTRLLYSRSIV